MPVNHTPWECPLYSVSPYNYDPEVRSLYNFREPLVILESTLAKMAHLQASRLYSAQDYVEVTGLLEEAGVQEVFDALKRQLDSLGNKYPVMLDEDDVQRVCLQVLG